MIAKRNRIYRRIFGVNKHIVYAEASFISNQEYYKEQFNFG